MNTSMKFFWISLHLQFINLQRAIILPIFMLFMTYLRQQSILEHRVRILLDKLRNLLRTILYKESICNRYSLFQFKEFITFITSLVENWVKKIVWSLFSWTHYNKIRWKALCKIRWTSKEITSISRKDWRSWQSMIW